MDEFDDQRCIQNLVCKQQKELRDLLWPPNLHVRVLLDRILTAIEVHAHFHPRDASGLSLVVDLSHLAEIVCATKDC